MSVNAVMERFFLNLKIERVWQMDHANHAEAIDDIADYIVGANNGIRLHSKLGNLSPNAFEGDSTSKKTYQAVRNYLTSTDQNAFFIRARGKAYKSVRSTPTNSASN